MGVDDGEQGGSPQSRKMRVAWWLGVHFPYHTASHRNLTLYTIQKKSVILNKEHITIMFISSDHATKINTGFPEMVLLCAQYLEGGSSPARTWQGQSLSGVPGPLWRSVKLKIYRQFADIRVSGHSVGTANSKPSKGFHWGSFENLVFEHTISCWDRRLLCPSWDTSLFTSWVHP